MTEITSTRHELEALIEQLSNAIEQGPNREAYARVLNLIGLARESLYVDLNHPLEYRDAARSAVVALEDEFGDQALEVAKFIQAQTGDRAFNKVVTKIAANRAGLSPEPSSAATARDPLR